MTFCKILFNIILLECDISKLLSISYKVILCTILGSQAGIQLFRKRLTFVVAIGEIFKMFCHQNLTSKLLMFI